jgi:transposase
VHLAGAYALLGFGHCHKSVNHAVSEFSRDEVGDSFHEVHVNIMEGFWALLRSWLRPIVAFCMKSYPVIQAFFAFIHNFRNCGKALLHSLPAT